MSPLAESVRAMLRPLAVEPTRLAPKLPRLPDIRAVIFDLYGTLLISDAGGERHQPTPDPPGLPGFETTFWSHVAAHHQRRHAEGIAHPEIDVRRIWRETLRALGQAIPSDDALDRAALAHECRCNPVWPMPGAESLLATLRRRGLPLGILSNAQFYTLPVLEGLFRADLDTLGFHPRLRVFSYEEGEGKPSPRLYQLLRDRAAALGIAPHQILHVGNDYHKDVLPARAAGFRTALFAGDTRSLRLGSVPETEAIATADLVITELGQVAECLG